MALIFWLLWRWRYKSNNSKARVNQQWERELFLQLFCCYRDVAIFSSWEIKLLNGHKPSNYFSQLAGLQQNTKIQLAILFSLLLLFPVARLIIEIVDIESCSQTITLGVWLLQTPLSFSNLKFGPFKQIIIDWSSVTGKPGPVYLCLGKYYVGWDRIIVICLWLKFLKMILRVHAFLP